MKNLPGMVPSLGLRVEGCGDTTPWKMTCGLISPCSKSDCVKSLQSSFMGLYPQRGSHLGERASGTDSQGFVCRVLWGASLYAQGTLLFRERKLFIDNLLIRVHFIIVMIRWTGLAPWEFFFR